MVLLKSPYLLDLSAAIDNKDQVEAEPLLGLDLDIFTEWSADVLLPFLMELAGLRVNYLVILFYVTLTIWRVYHCISTFSINRTPKYTGSFNSSRWQRQS